MYLSKIQFKSLYAERNCMFLRITELEEVFIDPYLPTNWGIYGIIWTAGSKYTHQFGEEKIEIPKDHFLFIGPEIVNNFIPNPDSDAYLVLFNSIFFGRGTRDTYFLQTYPYFHDLSNIYSFQGEFASSQSLKGIFNEILSKTNNEEDYSIYSNIMHKIIYLMMIFALTRIKSQRVKKQMYAMDHDFDMAMKFREEVSKNVHLENQVSYYADLLHISTRKLRNITNKIFGKPPKDIIHDFQTEKAMHLLSNTDIPIKEISFTLGFSDPSNFSNFFKNRTQKSPHNFRKKYNKHRLFFKNHEPNMMKN